MKIFYVCQQTITDKPLESFKNGFVGRLKFFAPFKSTDISAFWSWSTKYVSIFRGLSGRGRVTSSGTREEYACIFSIANVHWTLFEIFPLIWCNWVNIRHVQGVGCLQKVLEEQFTGTEIFQLLKLFPFKVILNSDVISNGTAIKIKPSTGTPVNRTPKFGRFLMVNRCDTFRISIWFAQ